MKPKFKAILMLIITISIIMLSAIHINDCVDGYAQTVLKNTVCSHINKSISDYVNSNAEKFTAVATHSYDDNGALVYISLNTAMFNSIKSELEQSLMDVITSLEATPFYVQYGNLSGVKMLSGIGPRIKFKIVPLGTLSSDTINTFNSVGINHTVHSVGLSFTVTFCAAAPFGSSSFEAQFDVTVCESIIIGQVPDVYFN